MPVNYGAYQIDPFQGFNQGLTNIGQALKYRREMERQTLLDAERKRLGDIQAETTRLSQISSRMGIEEVEATRKAESGLYSPEGGPPLDLAGTIQAKMEKEQNDKKRKQAFEKIKFIIDVNKSLGGTPEEKNKVIQGILANDPDEKMRDIASSIKVEGDEVSFTKEVTPEDIAKSGIRNPDGSPAIPGIYDLKGRATGDPVNPFRIIESKRRVVEKTPLITGIGPGGRPVRTPDVPGTEVYEKPSLEKEFAPQAQSLIHPKTGKRKWFDMNTKEGIEAAQREGFEPYEKPVKGDFKDKMIEKLWPTLTDDEQKRILGARIDPKELTEKNILDMYGNIMTDPNVRKSIQPIAEEIIKRATEKPKPSTSTGKVVNELPKGAKFQGYGADGKKIYEVPPSIPGGKPTYIKEQ